MTKLKIVTYDKNVREKGGQPLRTIVLDENTKNKYLELKENEGYLFFDWEEL